MGDQPLDGSNSRKAKYVWDLNSLGFCIKFFVANRRHRKWEPYSSKLHVDSYNGSHSWFSLFLTDKFSWLSQHFFHFPVCFSVLFNKCNKYKNLCNKLYNSIKNQRNFKNQNSKILWLFPDRKMHFRFSIQFGNCTVGYLCPNSSQELKQMCRLGGAIMAPELVTRFSWIRDCDNWHINPTFQSYQPFVYWHLCWTRTTTITIPLVFSLLHILLVVTDRIKPKHLTTAEFQFMNPLHQFSIN